MRYLLVIVLFFPTLTFAAGFATESIFLSKSPVTEGDSVRIYAVVANPTSAKFVGQVVVKEGDTAIGTVPASIEAGGTQTISVAWKPTAGSHTIVEELQATGGEAVETKSKSFSIAAKPKPVVETPAPQSAAAGEVESSGTIQNQINSISPIAGSAVAPVFSTLDSLRGKIAGVADEQLANAKSKMGGPGASSTNSGGSGGGAWGILWTLYFYLLTLLRFIIGNAGVFYPVVAVAFFYILWRVFRRIRRPS